MIRKGLKFISKWFDGIVEIDHVNEEDNDLEVYITPAKGQGRPEHWNLAHTIVGFEQGDYLEIKEMTNIFKENAELYQPLFDLMDQEYDEICLISEMDDIMEACEKVKMNFKEWEEASKDSKYK